MGSRLGRCKVGVSKRRIEVEDNQVEREKFKVCNRGSFCDYEDTILNTWLRMDFRAPNSESKLLCAGLKRRPKTPILIEVET